MEIEAREAVTSDASMDIALAQLTLSILGFAGVGLTVFYARLAWLESQRSANVAHETLEHMRQDAVGQDQRFLQQLEMTQKSADAAATAAVATKDLAQAAQDALEHSGRAAFGADVSGRAAVKANVIAQQTSTAQLRPYVYLVDVTIDWRGSWMMGGSPTGGEVTIRFKNFGVTPAKQARYRARVFTGGYWSEDFAPELSREVVIYAGDIPPGETKSQDGYYVTNLTPDTNQRIVMEGESLFVEGEIVYFGIDKTEYRTEFRRYSCGDDYRRGIFGVTPKGNDAK